MDNSQLTARTEFAAAINQIAAERGIVPQIIIDAIKQALIASYRKDYPEQIQEIEQDEKTLILADIDQDTGEFKILLGHEGDKPKQMKNITPPGFGRIAAQTAKQVILQQVREAEKTSILDEYKEKVGEVINGMVQRMDGQSVVVDIGRGQGYMPPEEQVKNEYYKLNSRLSILVKEIGETHRGSAVIVSRTDPKLVAGLFSREVPEVGAGSVIVKAIARDPGIRSKVAVESTQDGVDPVGSCVGQKGVRVQAVINELNGEKIDIVQYSQDQTKFIKAALAPAEGLLVKQIKEGEFVVTVPHDQLSLAIGRGGQNVKLAAKLINAKLKIISDKTDPGIIVTGNEEYEIDQLNLPTKIRNLLIEANLTKIEDILPQPEQLDNIKGIGPKSLLKIKEQLSVYRPSEEVETDTNQPSPKKTIKETDQTTKSTVKEKETKTPKPSLNTKITNQDQPAETKAEPDNET